MTKDNNEEILQLTVQEATELLLMSQSSVYSWIERGKFKTEELPSGKVIVISRNEVEKIKECNLKSRRNKVSKQNIKNSDNLQESNIIDAEFTGNYEENVTIQSDGSLNLGANSNISTETLSLIKMISEISAKAGKVDMLVDLQKQKQDDLDYWKEQYFAIKAENDMLKAELEKLKNRGLFGLFGKK